VLVPIIVIIETISNLIRPETLAVPRNSSSSFSYFFPDKHCLDNSEAKEDV